jgi:gas vesicle protein
MDIDKKYEQLLTNLELWAETLATSGPKAVDDIMGEMYDAVKAYTDELEPRLPALSLKEKLLQVRKQLTKELGEEPSDEVLASEMNLPGGVDTIRTVLAL